MALDSFASDQLQNSTEFIVYDSMDRQIYFSTRLREVIEVVSRYPPDQFYIAVHNRSSAITDIQAVVRSQLDRVFGMDTYGTIDIV